MKNSVIAPVGKYEYDALYRIVKAEGRELSGLGMATDADFVNDKSVPHTGSDVMQNYTQLYSYDELGNIISVQSQGRWTRDYFYDFPQNLPGTNRLLRHDELGSDVYSYDAHGNMISMPHLDALEWDYKGNLCKTITSGNQYPAYYRYDSQGNRVRKIYIHDNISEERIYIGNYELYRKKVNGTLETERETAFVSDDTKRIATVDTLLSPLEVTVRYQYDNHLGSACLELDSSAQVISYEEYHPFGTTSYRAGRNATETNLKRYKYVGKERDEETGLYYYGARYYAAWLCRFVSVDPLQFKYPELTPFQYASNRPISRIDIDGLEAAEPKTATEPGYLSPHILTEFRKDIIQGEYLSPKAETNTNRFKTVFTVRDNTKVAGQHQSCQPISAGKAAEIEEMKMHNLRQFSDPGSINPARSNLEKWTSTMIAPETRNMVQYDPVIRGVAAGALVTGALVNAPALLQTSFTSTSLISGGADFLSQMAFKRNFGDWNITQTLATSVFKFHFTQSTFGSALDIMVKDLGSNLFENTIFGQKDRSTFINESITGGVFNKLGQNSLKNSFPAKGVSKTMLEAHNLMVSYMLSNYFTGEIEKNIPIENGKK